MIDLGDDAMREIAENADGKYSKEESEAAIKALTASELAHFARQAFRYKTIDHANFIYTGPLEDYPAFLAKLRKFAKEEHQHA
jgi:hypothetical protein